MMASGNDLASVVYKVGHHGSDSSRSRLFLTAAAPAISIISSGIDNHYGHPDEELLQRISGVGAAACGRMNWDQLKSSRMGDACGGRPALKA
jgi:beta-lactamase superfamily II metal-dependent hydrolase